MRPGMVWIVLLGLVLFALAATLAAKAKSGATARRRFKAKVFMTPNELEFLGRLEQSVPELRFHAQVAMGALLDADTSRSENVRAHMSARGAFSQKIVDFVAQHRTTGEVVAIIELDDRTHHTGKDEKRDAMMREGGYKVIRWQSKAKPEGHAIRQALFAPVTGES